MALNQMWWEDQGYRSLSAVAFAAERAAAAGRFRPRRARLTMEWPGQERQYDWYGAEAIHDTRCYGIPARAIMTVCGSDPIKGEIKITAISNRHCEELPIVRISARGVATESVRAAFELARNTLTDPGLAMASERDVLEAKAAERHQLHRWRTIVLPLGVPASVRLALDAIEAHPASVALAGVIITAAIALLVR